MRHLTIALLALTSLLVSPSVAQPQEIKGYLYQTALTPESYLLTSPEELKAFTSMLSPVLPYKTLPAPANPDPFLKGFTVDFEQNVIAVAVGRNRINRNPSYAGIDEWDDGSRQVRFLLSAPTSEPYPFGWAVYTAVVLPRVEGRTTVLVKTLPNKDRWP
jgi:hypothetical protein